MSRSANHWEVEAVKYVLWVQDMDRAIAFYRDVFGLHESLVTPDWSELTRNETIIALHGGGDGKASSTGLSFQVSDIEAACEHIAANGGTILHPPQAREGEPIKLTNVSDPEGNAFMLTQFIGG